MSGSIGGIMQFNPVQGINPTAAYQQAAELEKTRAATGLIGQQATAADIQNQLAKARLGVQLPMIQSIAGGGDGAGGRIGAGAGAASAGPNGSAIGAQTFTGPGGTMLNGVGAVPRMLALGVVSSNDPTKEARELYQQKRAVISQLASSTLGVDGRADPVAWNQMVERAFRDGWMDNVQRAQFLNRPDLAQPLLNSFAPPESQPGFRGQVSYAEGVSHARTTPHDIMVPTAGGGMVPSATSNADVLRLPTDSSSPPLINVPGRGNQIAPQFDPVTGQPLHYSGGAPQMPPGVRPGGNPLLGPIPRTASGVGAGGLPVTGVEQFNEQQKAAIAQRSTLDTKQIEEDATRNEANVNAGLQANQAVLNLKEMRDVVQGLPTGAWADTRTALQSFATQFGGPWTQGLATQLTGMDKPTLAKMEEFNKIALNNVVKQEQAIGGARVGAMLTNYFAKASPNINMQQPAIKDIMNMALVGLQMTRDFADASNAHYNGARDATMESAAPDKTYVRYQPISKLEAQWTSPTSVHSPDVYAAAARLLNGGSVADAMKGLTKEQQVEAVHVLSRADPTWAPPGYRRAAAQ